MSRFLSPNLAKLPELPLPTRSFEAIYAARVAELTDRLEAKGIAFDTGSIDGDPLSAAEQAGAIRELVVLTERDDAIRAIMLATSWGSFLDHLGATQVPGVARKALVADPRPYVFGADAAQDWESDDDFRFRIQLAPEELSTCGSEGAYLSFALRTAGVKTAGVWGPMSFGGRPLNPFAPLGEVHIPVVATAGDGAASTELCAAVAASVSADLRRPLADFVTVSPAEIVPYSISATLRVGPGADAALIRDAAVRRLQVQANRQHRPGAAQLRRMLFGAAAVSAADGTNLVEDVVLHEPAGDVNAAPITPSTPACAYRAPFCTSVAVAVEVVND